MKDSLSCKLSVLTPATLDADVKVFGDSTGEFLISQVPGADPPTAQIWLMNAVGLGGSLPTSLVVGVQCEIYDRQQAEWNIYEEMTAAVDVEGLPAPAYATGFVGKVVRASMGLNRIRVFLRNSSATTLVEDIVLDAHVLIVPEIERSA